MWRTVSDLKWGGMRREAVWAGNTGPVLRQDPAVLRHADDSRLSNGRGRVLGHLRLWRECRSHIGIHFRAGLGVAHLRGTIACAAVTVEVTASGVVRLL